MKILALEPYLGGSHARFLDQLAARPEFEVEVRSLPARGWKWRMRFAALHFADELRRQPPAPADVLLVSTFLDLPQLVGFLPAEIARLPRVIYWHENQFDYPVRVEAERDRHFAVTNLLSARCADLNLFNSRYNLESLRDAAPEILRAAPDMRLDSIAEALDERSRIFPFPLDLENEPPCRDPRPADGPPIVLWNHRREHDKNPERFFAALFALAGRGLDFRVALAGQRFRDEPPVFAEARRRLGERLVHDGTIADRRDYLALLRRAEVAVSTTRHEFLGLAMLEATLQGARPLVPRRLVYPELYPERALYEEAELEDRLEALLRTRPGPDEELIAAFEGLSWARLGPELARILAELPGR